MRSDRTYKLLVAKMHEVAIIPPQTVGPFTSLYKKLTPYFKFYPWLAASLLSGLASLFLYILLGSTFVRLVSILQFGF